MKYCFIGIGNMASAIIGGMIKNGFAAKDIICCNRTFKKAADIAQKLGVTPVETIAEAVVSGGRCCCVRNSPVLPSGAA